jgi:hypothetical protein
MAGGEGRGGCCLLLAALGICAKLGEEGKVAESAGLSRCHSLSSRMASDRWDRRFRGVWFGVLKFNKYCSIFVLFDKKFSILD